jgi:hypothetical protein
MADQGLGIAHLAIVHYEKVLESVKLRMETAEDPEVRHVSWYRFLIQPNTVVIWSRSSTAQRWRGCTDPAAVCAPDIARSRGGSQPHAPLRGDGIHPTGKEAITLAGDLSGSGYTTAYMPCCIFLCMLYRVHMRISRSLQPEWISFCRTVQ